MDSDLIKLYTKRAEHFHEKSKALEKKYKLFSLVRLISFIGGAFFCLWLFSYFWILGLIGILTFVMLFGYFIKWHRKIKEEVRFYQAMEEVNRGEINYMALEFEDADGGGNFINVSHPYSGDLDLFGNYSLFQWINRASSSFGKNFLAKYFTNPSLSEELVKRQGAVSELSPQIDWRQEFMVKGRFAKENTDDLTKLRKWLSAPFLFEKKPWLRWVRWIIPVITILACFPAFKFFPWYTAIWIFLPSARVLSVTKKEIDHIHQQTEKSAGILKVYARLIHHIEAKSFKGELLRQLQTGHVKDDHVASDNIKHLGYIISQLNVRFNVFAIILNLLGLWDIQWVHALEKWKRDYGNSVEGYFTSLGHMEALSSLANLHFNNPGWVFPDLVNEGPLLLKEVGHPLIRNQERVSNDLGLPDHPHVKLITGSNMAGKSTFLRTIGINIVLAQSGAPVCASEMKCPDIKLYCSMRTQDSLHDHTSSFYAELKRLHLILEELKEGEKVFFLLDEILKGTNSRDRHTGSRALVSQLIKLGGSGLIATHDIELGTMEKENPGRIENLCMEVETKNGELLFDYKIRRGVTTSFNATELMRQMGIEV